MFDDFWASRSVSNGDGNAVRMLYLPCFQEERCKSQHSHQVVETCGSELLTQRRERVLTRLFTVSVYYSKDTQKQSIRHKQFKFPAQ